MQRLAKDQRAVSSQAKKLRTEPGIADLSDASGNEDQVKPTSAEKAITATSDDESEKIPQHEALAARDDAADFEKAARTVFLGNVSTQAIKSKTARRTLLTHLVSFAASADSPPKVESLRFRSTAFATAAMPKKAAFATGHLMDATTQGTNAYAVYSTAASARDAVKKLNGSVVLGRHLRADSVAHPAPVDHRRCVFVGNLGFVDDESLIKASEDAEDEGTGKRKRRKKPSGDVEEGLWQQFGKAGAVESVRVVRDKSTRVGKGIAYVQFKVCKRLLEIVASARADIPRMRVRSSVRCCSTGRGSRPSSRGSSALPEPRSPPKRRYDRRRTRDSGRPQRRARPHRRTLRCPAGLRSCLVGPLPHQVGARPEALGPAKLSSSPRALLWRATGPKLAATRSRSNRAGHAVRSRGQWPSPGAHNVVWPLGLERYLKDELNA